MNFELMIQNGDNVYIPVVTNGVMWTTDRRGAPGKLTFTVLNDETLDITEGNPVRLTVDGHNMFYGFIFTQKRDKKQQISVTAFDQLRYLTNKDTYVYSDLTASDVIIMIAEDFKLNLGTIEETEFRIASRVEDNSSLFDIIYNAMDLDLTNTGRMYVFYDDFGKLTLKSLDNMKLDILIDEETGESFDYTSSIDDNTYNRIKLSFENDTTGMRDIYIAQDGENINRWGILQFFDTLQEDENGEAKADMFLNLYNAKSRRLKISKVFGDKRVRAGSMPVVNMNLGDLKVQNYMLVEKCVHTFNNGEHWMDLTLKGAGI